MEQEYFAELDINNVVLTVQCVTAEFIAANPDRYVGAWVETWIDRDDKTYAGVGYTYSYDTQDFTPPPKPEPEPIVLSVE
jgi:hypothetical protein